MKFRVLILSVGALLLFAGNGKAECVDCFQGPCMVSYSDGTSRTFDDAPYCSMSPARDKGYENCRDVGDCRGCIGWTCVTRDPETMNVIQQQTRLKLVRVEIISPASDDHPRH